MIVALLAWSRDPAGDDAVAGAETGTTAGDPCAPIVAETGTLVRDVAELTAAIAAAGEGETITLAAGTYALDPSARGRG